MSGMRERVQAVRDEVARVAELCGRDPQEIRIVAVSKTHPAALVREGYEAGLRLFGENRVQEAEAKFAELRDLPLEWHLVGHLQTNKAKKAVHLFQLIHSVDSPKLIAELERAAKSAGRIVHVLLQLNLSGEATKSGSRVEGLESLLTALRDSPHLRCRGLMTMPPFEEDPERTRPFFRQLREIGERYRQQLTAPGEPLELSMGMSHDFRVAIEEGATLVRIGTALFGSRT
ncbi:MAG TPA: YggS family pyridoxal phosphate-dependent enzyme [bacterium]|nr:YggS family pyridoxal phosphate-dependent enzyme [bacterium]